MTSRVQILLFTLTMPLIAACGSDTTSSDAGSSNASASAATEVSSSGGKNNPPDKLRIKQGLWGYVTPGQEIGWFPNDPTGGDVIEPTAYTPPDEDGFYQLPFEPGESRWFCMITGPHSDATLRSECVEATAIEGLKYCGQDSTGWEC